VWTQINKNMVIPRDRCISCRRRLIVSKMCVVSNTQKNNERNGHICKECTEEIIKYYEEYKIYDYNKKFVIEKTKNKIRELKEKKYNNKII
jgi:superfamily II helicase